MYILCVGHWKKYLMKGKLYIWRQSRAAVGQRKLIKIRLAASGPVPPTPALYEYAIV